MLKDDARKKWEPPSVPLLPDRWRHCVLSSQEVLKQFKAVGPKELQLCEKALTLRPVHESAVMRAQSAVRVGSCRRYVAQKVIESRRDSLATYLRQDSTIRVSIHLFFFQRSHHRSRFILDGN